MARLYATTTCFQYPRTRVSMMQNLPLESEQRIGRRAELNLWDKIGERSSLGLYAMNGGKGPNSYAQNSSYQRGVVDAAKLIIEQEIETKLDTRRLTSTQTTPFRIADFGCSTGHNSFHAIQIITRAIENKFQMEGGATSQTPDFHVFFNDQVMNDFNTLFHSLPPGMKYYIAGVPGSFHGRLLPAATLDFAYSSCALHWLSGVPKAVEDPRSSAWNKGRVHYTGARKEVFKAYSDHFANDIGSFLRARAEELVNGGLMALLVPAFPTFEISEASYTTPTEMDLIGSCLVDMAEKGIVSEEKVDTFNFPLYFTVPQELRAIIERSQCLSIERMEVLNNPGKRTLQSTNARATCVRAVFEGLLMNHFGAQIMDDLFERYTNKLAAIPLIPLLLDPDNEKLIIIFVLLKRKEE